MTMQFLNTSIMFEGNGSTQTQSTTDTISIAQEYLPDGLSTTESMNGSWITATQNTTEIPFNEQLQTFLAYKIGAFIDKYWFPILCPFGFIGNTISLLVMVKKNNRKMSTCIYMAAISINDNAMMYLAFHNYCVMVLHTHAMNYYECKVVAYLTLACVQMTTWQVMAMTTDKYIAIRWPHKAMSLSTPTRSLYVTIAIAACVLIYNVPHLYLTEISSGICLGFAIQGWYTKFYSWLSFIINGIIPFSLLLHMNYFIVREVRRSLFMFEQQQPHDGAKATNEKPKHRDKAPNNVNSKRKQAENQLTKMLLLVTFLFLLLLFPSYFRFIYNTIVSSDTPEKYSIFYLMYHISHKFYTTNSGINFALYCLSGSKFRNDVKDLFCKCRNKKEAELPISESVTQLSQI